MIITDNTLAWMLAMFLLGAGLLHAEEKTDPNKPMFEIYGFAQADMIEDFNRTDPNWESTLRPSFIPTTHGTFGSNGQAVISVRQSRLGAQGSIPTDNDPVFGKFEFDMFGVGADAGQTTIRLRHAYGEWKQVLAGQTHSLFMDVDVFPDVIDYWGPTGMVFLRNPQIRWTPVKDSNVLPGKTSFAVAAEHPGSAIDAGSAREIDPALGPSATADDKMPDFTMQLRNDQDWGHVQLSSIFRRVGFETLGTPGNDPAGHDFGWGLSLTSNIKTIGKDKFDLSATYGEAISNYMNDGGVDLAPKAQGTGFVAAAVPLIGYMVYYDHYWAEKWESTFGYSRTQVENQSGQIASSYHSGQYASANLIYRPLKDVFFGAEYLWGERTDSGGGKGVDNRIQFSGHYNFSTNALFDKLKT